MKYLIPVLCALALCACTTVTDPETGKSVSRVDWDGVNRGIDVTFGTWQRYDQQRKVVRYAPDGTPIYVRP